MALSHLCSSGEAMFPVAKNILGHQTTNHIKREPQVGLYLTVRDGLMKVSLWARKWLRYSMDLHTKIHVTNKFLHFLIDIFQVF